MGRRICWKRNSGDVRDHVPGAAPHRVRCWVGRKRRYLRGLLQQYRLITTYDGGRGRPRPRLVARRKQNRFHYRARRQLRDLLDELDRDESAAPYAKLKVRFSAGLVTRRRQNRIRKPPRWQHRDLCDERRRYQSSASDEQRYARFRSGVVTGRNQNRILERARWIGNMDHECRRLGRPATYGEPSWRLSAGVVAGRVQDCVLAWIIIEHARHLLHEQ